MNSFSNNHKDWIDVFSAIMPILLTAFAVFYTHKQTKIAEGKRRDDLYDKRIEVYNQLLIFCRKINHEKGWSDKKGLTDILYNKVMPHHFLFGAEIKSLIDEIDGKYRGIGVFKNEGEVSDEIKNNTINEVQCYKVLIVFFRDLPTRLEREFEPYLRLESVSTKILNPKSTTDKKTNKTKRQSKNPQNHD